MKRALVTGAGGFIGHHLVKALKAEGYYVRAADLVEPAYDPSPADSFEILDLRSSDNCLAVTRGIDEVYALAADMGGMGYLAENDTDVFMNNLCISAHTVDAAYVNGVRLFFHSSSACVYPEYRQSEAEVTPLREADAYPAAPADGYGWEKLTTERMLLAYLAERRMDVRIARFHNIYGPLGTWRGGREKAPAAMCRKVAQAGDGGEIEIWGDGRQTRSFCYIDDCVEGILRLVASGHREPLNLGSDQLVTIDELAGLVIGVAGKDLSLRHVPGPQGVRGRNSDNSLCARTLGWRPSTSLRDGLAVTYDWIQSQVQAADGVPGPDFARQAAR